MIRHLLVALALCFGLPACGVGVDEDLAALGIEAQALELGAGATVDPVPPKEALTEYRLVMTNEGPKLMVLWVSRGSGNPDENTSTTDPVPPKNANNTWGKPVPGDNPNLKKRR